MKNKDRISQRLQKAKNALFALAAQGVHAQGVSTQRLSSQLHYMAQSYGQTLQPLTSQSFQDSSTMLQNASKVYRHAPVPTWQSLWSD